MAAEAPGLVRPARIVWAERLNALDALRLRAFAGPRTQVRYDEHRASAGGLSLARALGLEVAPAELTFARLTANGEALQYRRDDLLDAALETFCARRAPGRPARRRRALKSYLADLLMPRLTFLVMAETSAREAKAAENAYYVVRHPANALLFDRGPLEGAEVAQSWDVRGWARILGAPLRQFLRLAFSRASAAPAAARPSVWAEYYPDDVSGYGSRVFWRGHARGAYDKVFYLDRPDTQPDPATLAAIASAGFGAVDCREPWTLAPADPSPSLARLADARRGAPLWLRLFDFEYDLLVRMWEAVFRRFKVGLLVEHQEFSWRRVAQAEAIERAGGRMLGLHWSDFPITREPIHASPQHVFFVWGLNNARWLRAKSFDGEHVLPSGMWIVPDEKKAAELEKRVAGAAFTLAIFDSSFHYTVFPSPAQLAAFLDAALGLLERHPTWKGIMKPKSDARYPGLPGREALEKRIDALAAAGRLIVLERLIAPSTAALAADLALSVASPSAAVVSGAFGAKALCWDCVGWTRHPLYQEPDQKLLYRELPELISAVEAAAAGDKTVGDFSRWAGLANHFEDAKAAERVGSFVDSYMARLASAPAGRALSEAAAEYRKTQSVPDFFDVPGPWWREGASTGTLI